MTCSFLVSGSPAVLGDKEEDAHADAVNNINISPERQNQEQKLTEHMLSWHTTYRRGGDVGSPHYDKEVHHSHIPLLTNGTEACL